MFAAILAIMLLPITDLGRSKGLQFRPISKLAFWVFVVNFLILMKLGACHVETPFIELGQLSTVLYFSYFIIIVPVISLIENTLVDLSFGGVKIRSKILISTVDINNHSPRTFKRDFHSTRPNKLPELVFAYDFAVEMLNIFKLEEVQFLINNAIVHWTPDLNGEPVTKAITYLLSETKGGNGTFAQYWNFNTNQLPGEGGSPQATLNELIQLKTRMDNNLANTKLAYKLSQDVHTNTISKQAARLILNANFKW